MRFLSAVLTALTLSAGGLQAQVSNTSYVSDGGERVLQHTVEIEASPAEVWAAFTTTEGVRSWVTPVAQVDFRMGGVWEASYKPDGRLGDPDNILNEYLAAIPERLLTMRIRRAPPTFENGELLPALSTVIEIEPLGEGRVRVRESMTGFDRADARYDRIYAFFDAGNAYSLAKLKQALEK